MTWLKKNKITQWQGLLQSFTNNS